MNTKDFTIKGLRKIYRKIFKPQFVKPYCEMDRQKANDLIYDVLTNDNPCMISRFGTTEIGIVNNYLTAHSSEPMSRRMINYIKDNTGLPWWDTLIFKFMHVYSGIFPETIDTLDRFSERYLQDIPEIDLLGSFNYTERFMPLRKDVINVHLECLYPFFVERPWTRALKGKKVLVIHPFIDTIKQQHARHDKVFENKEVFPEYELLTVKAVQSVAGTKVPFKDWFEALKYMEDEISKLDFDFAIIGCGAYGLPLAAHVKRMGKKALHLGGGSQLLFGIKGKRWDNNRYHWRDLPQLDTNYSRLYNEYWTRANQNETPKSATKVEGACYW
ncbi:MAG: hypothetical protein HDR82_11270 [Bacteroides sp.]|nr:hypothetical protein [Bacteroides sp.]